MLFKAFFFNLLFFAQQKFRKNYTKLLHAQSEMPQAISSYNLMSFNLVKKKILKKYSLYR